ncbi:MAG: serine/threonine protein kinase [Sandaracinaceae bacterium]|nr:serine/threonine protein kinase [Sandaracinaceae bacterium]
MGRVYAATEIHSDRRVALKVLHGERMAEAETVARFKREAEVLASIGHPCIVEVYAFHQTDNIPYIAMELLEGVTLKTRLQNAGRFQDPADLQEIVDCIASALEVAHDADVIHRDLKPDNIFLPATGDPRAKLVDFGLSRVARQDKNITTSGMIIGTPRYMAPEQIKNASGTGPGSDIYSFGVILFECLTGQSPYPAQDYGQLLGCLLEGRTTPFLDHRPDLAQLGSFFPLALAPDVTRRYQTAGELADGYAEAIGRPSRREEIRAKTRRPPKRKRSKSLAGMVPSRSSTLAWDASAARGALAELEKGPPPGMKVDPEALEARSELGFARTPEMGIQKGSWSDGPSAGFNFDDASVTEPSRPQYPVEPSQPALVQNPPSRPPPPMVAPAPIPQTPAPLTPAPIPRSEAPVAYHSNPPPSSPSHSVPPEAVKAQGGDTLYLGDAQGLVNLPPSYAPGPASNYPPNPSFSGASAKPAPAPAAPAKKRSFGLILFFVALLLVVVLSALGGFALRAHMRGELELPGSHE